MVFGAGLFGLLLALAAVVTAIRQPWLGVELAVAGSDQPLRIASVSADGPAARVAPGQWVTALSSAQAHIELQAVDRTEEPDMLPSYHAIRAFLARQQVLAGILRSGPVTLWLTDSAAEVDGGLRQPVSVVPADHRPIAQLPSVFWMQLLVGLAGFWMGVWVWGLRRGEWSTRHLALVGFGLMLAAFSAAVYSTRELALPTGLFRTLSAFNHFGTLLFGAAMLGLFMAYPRTLLRPRWALLPAALLASVWGVDALRPAQVSSMIFQTAILICMAAIVVLVIWQRRSSKGDPRARAALQWLGLGVVLGAGGFVLTVILPTLLGLGAVMTQGHAFLFFLVIYAGLALGVARYRLFELNDWAFRILFYLVGVLMLVGLDALLIYGVAVDRLPALGLSLLLVAALYLPLRDALARWFLGYRGGHAQDDFRQVLDLALAPPGHDQPARWQKLLQAMYRPLSIEKVAPVDAPQLEEEGLALRVPGLGALPPLRLTLADSGRRLFAPRDVTRVSAVLALLRHAEDSRDAYENGVAEERTRIARDMHDNIGLQLMSALTSPESARKDGRIRAALAELRDIVNNVSGMNTSFEESMADLRQEVDEDLVSAGIQLRWHMPDTVPATLPASSIHALRSLIREAASNVIKHSGADAVSVTIHVGDHDLWVDVEDNGRGMGSSASSAGNGLANLRARMASLGGRFDVRQVGQGVCLRAAFPLPELRRRGAMEATAAAVTRI
ncbi:ATP-binding protein [Flagellatimonas centrodinii]|uniref:sensor histidine kinase n=1 Tax=Flagellatimonas centrodinii TaxID=2806210 RepID=UPI001EFB12F5|nr:ATP-binding protein [Flagellatimonas centrodinii]ULQ46151.1 ATP-binding protein [Flagellatimonas centrodinii]